MNRIEFRQALAGDAGAILRVTAQAFGRAPWSVKYERDRKRITSEIDAYWVLVQEGIIVGTVHIRRDEIQVGRSVLAKADVGEVCITPDRQGEGLGTTLM